MLRRHQQWSAIDQTLYFGALQTKQLSTNNSAVFDSDAVMFICAERWSQIHGIRPLNKLTVGDACTSDVM